jgi:hypothetical protein
MCDNAWLVHGLYVSRADRLNSDSLCRVTCDLS